LLLTDTARGCRADSGVLCLRFAKIAMSARVCGLVRLQGLTGVWQARSSRLAVARALITAHQQRQLHSAAIACKKVDFLLADVGEGIAEVEVLNW